MTPDILLVYAVLTATALLFMSDRLRVDVVAILSMLSLGWLGLLTPREVFSGFASNAVISIIGVMILGYGIDRTGVMSRVSRPLLRLARNRETRLITLSSGAAGGISAFMQNIGAAALFLPALTRISRQSGIPASRLLMPMGFAAILGGTLTMVASGPLILLNDLLRSTGLAGFGLFDVTPIGLALLGSGILYFALLGKWVLPARSGDEGGPRHQQIIRESYDLPSKLFELELPADSPLVGRTREETRLEQDYGLALAALSDGRETLYAPWRQARFAAGQILAVLGDESAVQRLAETCRLRLRPALEHFAEILAPHEVGFAEAIIAPRAPLIGKTLREFALRQNFEVEPLLVVHGSEPLRSDFSDLPLQAGDTFVLFGRWDKIRRLVDDENFVLATPVEGEEINASKANLALLCFGAAIALALSGAPLALAFLSGAVAMVLLGVLRMDEAYRAVDWRTVFLLAGLIPLGTAMEKTGAAAYLANQLGLLLQDVPVLLILVAVAALTTVFSLFMSNVAATVLLVPLVMPLGEMAGVDPRALALLVGVSASNAFFLPTHQVNALLMGPGGYRNADYMRAGGLMSLLFIGIAVGMIYLFYL